jgi:glycosyltransferase involved in cell wall biosynthesis
MITVVIATRNRAALLRETLAALAAQTDPGCPFEIIVADNGSTDDTAAVVAAAAASAPVLYIHEPRPGKSHALNTAVARARGDLLVLTDDDVLPSARWLAAYARTFADPAVDFAAGRILPLWEAPPPRWMSPALYGVLAVPDGGAERRAIARGVHDDIMPLGANMAVRRSVVERVGGWNTDLGKLQGTLRTGEDHEFSLRMIDGGCRGAYDPEASVRHRVPRERLRLAYFARWFFDNGAIEAGLEHDHPTSDRYLLNVPRYLWRRIGVSIASAAAGAATLDVRRAIAGLMQAIWFVGYLRGRWTRRGNAVAAAGRAAISGAQTR